MSGLLALLSLFSRLTGIQDYYLFDWMLLFNNTIGYAIAVGLLTVCIFLPRGLPWWGVAMAGAGAGAMAGVLAGAYNFIVGAHRLTTLNVLFLAAAGALPGLVIPTIHACWLASRRVSVFHYIGAAIAAGTLISLFASVILVLGGAFNWSLGLVDMVFRQLWLVPTVFSVVMMAALFVADSVLEHHISFGSSTCMRKIMAATCAEKPAQSHCGIWVTAHRGPPPLPNRGEWPALYQQDSLNR